MKYLMILSALFFVGCENEATPINEDPSIQTEVVLPFEDEIVDISVLEEIETLTTLSFGSAGLLPQKNTPLKRCYFMQ